MLFVLFVALQTCFPALLYWLISTLKRSTGFLKNLLRFHYQKNFKLSIVDFDWSPLHSGSIEQVYRELKPSENAAWSSIISLDCKCRVPNDDSHGMQLVSSRRIRLNLFTPP
mmetsp:Transcript_121300/g.247756  ORF Transcript_121300/g.247756 Transcript_121300/m.247756 type:complete len:112 (-) Transcript_121300:1446-1781(-)